VTNFEARASPLNKQKLTIPERDLVYFVRSTRDEPAWGGATLNLLQRGGEARASPLNKQKLTIPKGDLAYFVRSTRDEPAWGGATLNSLRLRRSLATLGP
jgi:hypothetical protein